MSDRHSRHPKVQSDIDDLAVYVGLDDKRVATRFVLTVEDSIALLATTPELGPVFPTDIEKLEDIRVYPIPFPDAGHNRRYLIFYKPESDGVRVLYVFHGSRDIPTRLKKDVRY